MVAGPSGADPPRGLVPTAGALPLRQRHPSLISLTPVRVSFSLSQPRDRKRGQRGGAQSASPRSGTSLSGPAGPRAVRQFVRVRPPSPRRALRRFARFRHPRPRGPPSPRTPSVCLGARAALPARWPRPSARGSLRGRRRIGVSGSSKARGLGFRPPARPPAAVTGGTVCRTRASRAPEGAGDTRREWPSVVAVPRGRTRQGRCGAGRRGPARRAGGLGWGVGPGSCRIVCACACACVCMSVRARTYVYLCTRVYVCTYVCARVYLCTCGCTCVHPGVHVCKYLCAHVYVPIRTLTCVCTCTPMCVYIHACACVRAALVYVCLCMCVHMYICQCVHLCMCTCTCVCA